MLGPWDLETMRVRTVGRNDRRIVRSLAVGAGRFRLKGAVLDLRRSVRSDASRSAE